MRLVLADIEEDVLAKVSESLPAGTEVVTVRTDVARPEQVEALRDAALDAFGAVHVLCNNAGVGSGGPMATLPLSDWEWVLGVNLWGVIHGVRAFLPVMEEQGEGHIVNTASAAGLFAAPYMGPYNVSKYGVVALSETLFQELRAGESPVGVSVLCPSWVKTNIASSSRNRPGGHETPAGEDVVAGVISDFLATGIEPGEVADKVAEAVKSRTFWILTHDDTAAAITLRTRSLLEGTDPPSLLH
jgi:NAD(P)-dependent dehydrogenase (short-subunit alcohol dehydrogenase family)